MRGEQATGGPAARFDRRLSGLKRAGCTVLLVGTDGLEPICERLLGDPGAGPRYRLFVTTDATPETAASRLEAVGPRAEGAGPAVVNWGADVRATAAAGPNDRPLRTVAVGGGDLEDLAAAVDDAIAALAVEADPAPAELRVCLDSLAPLVSDYEAGEAEAFIESFSASVDRVKGMAHCHLPADYGTDAVARLEPLFDAVVEVRRAPGGLEQRWHLTDPVLDTDWLAV